MWYRETIEAKEWCDGTQLAAATSVQLHTLHTRRFADLAAALLFWR